MSTSFIIDTPSHKRWLLPDGVHVMNSVIYGETLRWSIWPQGMGPSHERLSGYIEIKEGWEDLWELCQKLANKRFPRDVIQEARRMRFERQHGR